MRGTCLILIVTFFAGCKKDKIENLNYSRDFNVYYAEGSGWTGWLYELNIDSVGFMTIHEKNDLPTNSKMERKNNPLNSSSL
jgi:hypothetical protein